MWLLSGRCTSQARLDGKTAIITGANCGIGKWTAYDFVKRGARVIIACRDLKRAKEAAEDIRENTKYEKNVGEVAVVMLDLSDLASVRTSAEEILQTEARIDILVNNAGVCYHPKDKTKDGFEMHFGVNHLGHFLFTCLLLPRITRSAPARIVTVASLKNYLADEINFDDLNWEKRKYSAFYAYSESKLANVMFSAELARRLKGTGVTTYSLHPGLVVTNGDRYSDFTWFPGASFLFQTIGPFIFKNCEQGAQTTIHCAVSEETGKQTGLYYSDCKLSIANPKSYDPQVADRLWNVSAKMVGLGDWDPFSAEDTIAPSSKK